MFWCSIDNIDTVVVGSVTLTWYLLLKHLVWVMTLIEGLEDRDDALEALTDAFAIDDDIDQGFIEDGEMFMVTMS